MTQPAFSMALLFWGQRCTPEPEADVAYAISELHEEWTEERKADLYALLADKVAEAFLTDSGSFNAVLHAVKKAYASNERWAARHG